MNRKVQLKFICIMMLKHIKQAGQKGNAWLKNTLNLLLSSIPAINFSGKKKDYRCCARGTLDFINWNHWWNILALDSELLDLHANPASNFMTVTICVTRENPLCLCSRSPYRALHCRDFGLSLQDTLRENIISSILSFRKIILVIVM